MSESTRVHHPASGPAHTALGRLTLLEQVDGGTEKATYERRWPDASAARAWCEDKVQRAPEGTRVIEIQVTEEVWGRRHAWEAIASRHIPETLQLGMHASTGVVTWGEPLEVGNDLGRPVRS